MSISAIRQVIELEHKSTDELRKIYNNLFAEKCLNHIHKEQLRLKIAYRLQELAFGGLGDKDKAKLEAFARDGAIAKAQHESLLPGTKICREHNGVMHEVEVTKDGFEYKGQKWSSLSAIATKITGTKWSGPKFFGLKG